MKQRILPRLLLLLLAFGMIFVLTACGKGEPSEPADASVAESEPEGEIIEGALVRPNLMKDLNAGIKRNNDTVGWLYIPNTDINDAILQSTDNDYYLRIDEDKVYDIYGSYFMDYESTPQGAYDKISRNNIIYGHSDLRDNPDGKDFSQLFRFLDADFLSENPYIYYSTKGGDMVWQIFAVCKTHTEFRYHLGKPNEATFLWIVDEMVQRSEFILDVPVTAEDKILTLSTCMAADDYRVIVSAKLLPADKQLAPTAEVKVNPSPKAS